MQVDETAVQIVRDVRSGRRPAFEVVAGALARAADDRCNAIVTLCAERAMDEAAAIDQAVADGEDPGPLAGVPFTAKDTIATAGIRTTAGSRLLTDHIPEQDAACVARLRGAGAVLIGKTNCPEFALQARTDNLVFGATTHPADPKMSPGGSSGGCAATVAAGIVPVSIGGDYGGSIRYPASCTGLFGLRPTRGAVDGAGTLPAAPTGTPRHHFQEVGPLARTLDDLVLVDSVLRNDPGTRSHGTRVGLVPGGWPIDDDTRGALERSATVLADQGIEVSTVDAAPFIRATEVFDAWRATDDYADLREFVAGREQELTPHIRSLVAAPHREVPGRELTAIIEAAGEIERAVADLLRLTPVLMLPVALVGALPIAATHVDVDGRPEPLDSLRILAPSRAISLLGLPALAVPAGTDARGLPVGVQLVAHRHAGADLYRVATLLTRSR